MNKYRVYFKDGSSTTCKAMCKMDAKFIICLRTGRPVSDIDRIAEIINLL